MKKKSIGQVILGSVVAAVATGAVAQNSEIRLSPELVTSKKSGDNASSTNQQKPATVGQFIEVGTPADSAAHKAPLKGFATELPLLTVMKQVTPNGWIVKKSDSPESKLDTSRPISWQGGKSWPETLKDISNRYALDVIVNWKQKVIVLSNAKTPGKLNVFEVETDAGVDSQSKEKSIHPAVKAPVPSDVTAMPVHPALKAAVTTDVKVAHPVATTPLVSEPVAVVRLQEEKKEKALVAKEQVQDITVGASEQKEVLKPAPVAAPVASWKMDSNKSLKSNVEGWAQQAGYRLVWIGEDYPVDMSRTLHGAFDSVDGPIKQLSIDYGPDSRVQNPLSFQFYQNKTLVVENHTFEQSGYPQFNKKD